MKQTLDINWKAELGELVPGALGGGGVVV